MKRRLLWGALFALVTAALSYDSPASAQFFYGPYQPSPYQQLDALRQSGATAPQVRMPVMMPYTNTHTGRIGTVPVYPLYPSLPTYPVYPAYRPAYNPWFGFGY